MTLGFGGGARPMSRGGGGPPIQELTPFGALRFEPTSVSMLPDGSLDVGGFSPGDYAVVEGHSREGLTQQTFTVAKESARTITVGASVARPEPQGTTGTLSGTVVLAQTPCPGALLLLVPISGGSGGVRRQQSNTDGSFRFDDVPLGRYIVVAVDQGWSIDFRDRQTLSAFLMHGVPIDFERSTTMTTPLQAQAR